MAWNPFDPAAVRRFLGIGPSSRERIPCARVVEKTEYCVMISLFPDDGTIQRYHCHENDRLLVPPGLDYANALCSYGKIWVHSYFSWDHAERQARRQAKLFWKNGRYLSRFMDPTPDGHEDGSLRWFLLELWQDTARDKDAILNHPDWIRT